MYLTRLAYLRYQKYVKNVTYLGWNATVGAADHLNTDTKELEKMIQNWDREKVKNPTSAL
jgi:hypothetical protein